MPVQRTLFPKIEIADQQDRDVNHHFIKAISPESAKNHRPRVEKNRFHIEKNKNHRDQVKLHGKWLASITGRLHAALVSLLLGASWPPPTDYNGKGADQSGQQGGDQ